MAKRTSGRVSASGTPRKAVSAGGRSPQWRAAYREMQQGVRRLEVSIGDVRAGLHFAERSIRHQARERILGLRREAAEQLRGLRSRQREAAGKLARVGDAADESWSEIRASFDAIVAEVLRKTPLGRYGQPDEIAGGALFLASDAASFMTGQVMVIDGGMTSC